MALGSAHSVEKDLKSLPAKKNLNFLGTPQYRLCPLLFHHTITSAPMLVYICSRFPLQECCAVRPSTRTHHLVTMVTSSERVN